MAKSAPAQLMLGKVLICWAFTLACVAGSSIPKWLQYYDVSSSVNIAKTILSSRQITNTKDRLALMMLYSFPLNEETKESAAYYQAMKCSLALLEKNVRQSTPVDLYIFLKGENLPKLVPEWLTAHNPILMPLDPGVWEYPAYLRPEGNNWSKGFSKDYRLMGHWRLAFQFAFARQLGYQYLFQFDSDTYVKSNIGYNLVDFMRQGGYWATNYWFYFYENLAFFQGLPELARFWLVTRRGGGCNGWDLRVAGPLWNHTHPPGLDGLYTPITHCEGAASYAIFQNKTWEGYSGWCIAGHYTIWDLEFWFQEDVQDFVHLVLRSGAHIEHRWVDVSTQSMIINMFIPPHKFHIFRDHTIGHGRNPQFSGVNMTTCMGLLPRLA
mmetsp:Transcript_39883/g.88648  ORF Transcript_39883/g.88648 Transcript_39883/m.88648 type:complete len:381 (+) Transcript_39883:198-1340(+)|eukprot:CAMPEP_0202893110 /NCGR_PEP_ID=MMETSP1392-20130828/2744_1 /ASSEMBLY_ACC=CAM_ASM_000868 /TAXON_ID=225041 /ORGANISM="Chlamydomonas chlamydogama, Strain SAG 11-48b" /LENGTH=380 /DNA_ID=CAMNT_0049577313 /DNA_START=198 /DNA_END=1340 /DNA_ORIENTATION=-